MQHFAQLKQNQRNPKRNAGTFRHAESSTLFSRTPKPERGQGLQWKENQIFAKKTKEPFTQKQQKQQTQQKQPQHTQLYKQQGPRLALRGPGWPFPGCGSRSGFVSRESPSGHTQGDTPQQTHQEQKQPEHDMRTLERPRLGRGGAAFPWRAPKDAQTPFTQNVNPRIARPRTK